MSAMTFQWCPDCGWEEDDPGLSALMSKFLGDFGKRRVCPACGYPILLGIYESNRRAS